MKRCFAVLEGREKGNRLPLDLPLILVGRSTDADIQLADLKVSRRHLEVRVDEHGVWVTNRSEKGSVLNGKAIVGTISLNAGDLLEIGETKLRYEEQGAEPVAAPAPMPEPEAVSAADLDATRLAPSDSVDGTQLRDETGIRKRAGAGPDATRVVEDDGTRILNAEELPAWKARRAKKAASGKGVWIILLVVGLLAAGGTAFQFAGGQRSTVEFATYKEPVGKFTLRYPSEWPKVSDTSDFVAYGVGTESGNDWVQVRIYVDADTNHVLTGLTDGFKQYADGVLKQSFKDFILVDEKDHFRLHENATAVFFRFRSSSGRGFGIYVLDAETRIVIEGLTAPAIAAQYESVLESVLRSFTLALDEPQQFIDFPMPDETLKTEALNSPELQAQKISEHMRLGAMLLADRDVKTDNLYRARQEYAEAARWSIARPQRLTNEYQAAATGLLMATKLFDQALKRQLFAISYAKSQKNFDAEYWAAVELMKMVSDKSDPAYQEGYHVVRSLRILKGKQQ